MNNDVEHFQKVISKLTIELAQTKVNLVDLQVRYEDNLKELNDLKNSQTVNTVSEHGADTQENK